MSGLLTDAEFLVIAATDSGLLAVQVTLLSVPYVMLPDGLRFMDKAVTALSTVYVWFAVLFLLPAVSFACHLYV